MNFLKSRFMSSNSTGYRLARTIAQGVIGVIVANIDMVIGWINISNDVKPFIVALVMAILSPIMGALSDNSEQTAEEQHDYDTEAVGLQMLREAEQAEGYIGEDFSEVNDNEQ